MLDHQSTLAVRLFYSYSHKDQQYQEEMEKSLSLLESKAYLNSWSDKKILPGSLISEAIPSQMDQADIFVFLLSHNFLASGECMKEWNRAKEISLTKSLVFRIPIILEPCAWLDLLEKDNLKALPQDGNPICTFTHQAEAWNQVYGGIKSVILALRRNFSPKPEFLNEIQRTEFLSNEKIQLEDLYVFPRLSCYTPKSISSNLSEELITNERKLLSKKRALVHGDDVSGKSALGRHLFLHLTNHTKPVLYVDLAHVSGNPREKRFKDAYGKQFRGDYDQWKQQANKTLILDNLTANAKQINFLIFAKDFFSNIIVTLSSDIYTSYFSDDSRFADFYEIKIQPFTHSQQEELIRKRLGLIERPDSITDGLVDQVEDRVNSIIITNKIVPRYPFYVLSILQTYESFMPDNLSITSFGHCYHVLIISKLIKAGISHADRDINPCFNFLERLAYKIYRDQENGKNVTWEDFLDFVDRYRESFYFHTSTLNRLIHDEFGIITKGGSFRATYMYFFFLGRFFAKAKGEEKCEIAKICNNSYIYPNDLIILFIIHHTISDEIIEDIVSRTQCTLEGVEPARLHPKDTSRFFQLVASIRKSFLRENSVEKERKLLREIRDEKESTRTNSEREAAFDEESRSTHMYRVTKNVQILGQVLRNRYGSLERSYISEVVETVSDGGLRLVNCILADEAEINKRIVHLKERYPSFGEERLKRSLHILSFLWTMGNIEIVVHAINVPEIRDTIEQVVRERNTPAYDLIGYFNSLDSQEELTDESAIRLASLWKKHKDPFMRSVLSFRTQHYMNTHVSKVGVEQKVCAQLGVPYVHHIGRS